MRLPTLDLSRAVLVPKATKVEHDMRRLGFSRRQLAAYYRKQNAAVIFASHERQKTVRRRVVELWPEARVISRDSLTREAVRDASLVVAIGGDNHFIYASHFLDGTPILGINADRLRSHGGLLSVDEKNLEAALSRVRRGLATVRSLTRLEAFVDGRRVGRATSEILAGEERRRDMSRHALSLSGGPEEEQKCAGLLVSTAAGSTGWFGAYAKPWPRQSRFARWSLTEPFPRGRRYRLGSGRLGPDDVLSLRSLNDARGVLSLDSLQDAAWPYGSVATIRLSGTPLNVVEP